MQEVRTYIDRDWYLRIQSGPDGATVLESAKVSGYYMPDDPAPRSDPQQATAASFVSNLVFQIVNAADKFCKQCPDGPQVEAAQPDPRVAELQKELEKKNRQVEKLKGDLEAFREVLEKCHVSISEIGRLFGRADEALKECE